MPNNAGAQLVREVHAAHPGTPLIAILGAVLFRSLAAAARTAQMLGVQRVLQSHLTRGDVLERYALSLAHRVEPHERTELPH